MAQIHVSLRTYGFKSRPGYQAVKLKSRSCLSRGQNTSREQNTLPGQNAPREQNTSRGQNTSREQNAPRATASRRLTKD